jgi:hypothetical protein
MPVVVSEEEEGGPENDTDTPEEEGGARQGRRFLTRATASGRKIKEASLTAAIHMMGLDLDPDNVRLHETLIQEHLQDVEKEHNDFIVKERLDLNKEPQKSYMTNLEGKVSRAIIKHRTKLKRPPGPAPG